MSIYGLVLKLLLVPDFAVAANLCGRYARTPLIVLVRGLPCGTVKGLEGLRVEGR